MAVVVLNSLTLQAVLPWKAGNAIIGNFNRKQSGST